MTAPLWSSGRLSLFAPLQSVILTRPTPKYWAIGCSASTASWHHKISGLKRETLKKRLTYFWNGQKKTNPPMTGPDDDDENEEAGDLPVNA